MTVLLLLALGAGWTPAAHGQSIVVGSGSSWAAGNATHEIGCHDFTNNGTADLGTATFNAVANFTNTSIMSASAASIDVGGNWANSGTVDAGSSMISLTDDCGAMHATISGTTTFPTLAINSSVGKVVEFAAGATQTVTDALILGGQSGALLVVRSTQDGQQAFIDLESGATQSIAHVDVADHAATGQVIAPGPAEDFDSIDAGNNTRWFVSLGPAPAPTLSVGAMLLVLALLIAVAHGRLRARDGARPGAPRLNPEERG